MSQFSLASFLACPVIAIVRGFKEEHALRIVEIAARSGLTNLEITMNTPNAAALIRQARSIAGGALNLGAGTVTSLELLEEAWAAGAMFIVTPTLHPEVILECGRRGCPVIPGALTPSEVARAHELGADWVKIFPSEWGGPRWIASLKSILPEARLAPTGGVTLETLAAYRAAGADAYGVGSPLFRSDRIRAGDWDWVETQCRAWRAFFDGSTDASASRST